MEREVAEPFDFTGFPGWVETLALGIFAVSGGLAMGVSRFGWLKGKSTPDNQKEDAAAVAAVIVDSAALRDATRAVDSLTVQIGELTTEIRDWRSEQAIEDEVERRLKAERAGQSTRRRAADP